MNRFISKTVGAKNLITAACIVGCAWGFSEIALAAEPSSQAVQTLAFDGEKTAWHGFDRYDFLIDEQTLEIKPIKAQDDEKDGIRHQIEGQRRCIAVVPKTAAPGNPWSWRGCYWDHQPQTEIELLKRGFHICYIESGPNLRPGKQWDAWYAFLTEKHGLSKKPAFIGMSRGGEFSFTWATAHPENVSAIYADNPGCNPDVFRRLGDLARADVPVLQICGSVDPLLGKNASALEAMYQQFGGRVSMMIKEGAGHHPHSLHNPKIMADFIEQSVKATPNSTPAFVVDKGLHSSFYSTENSYCDFPEEGTHITCRGPLFTNCYDRYEFQVSGVEGSTTVIAPKVAAPGNPWVYRAAFVSREDSVDLALLAKGFHIVTGPVPYNLDGPVVAHWNTVYKHLTDSGFAKKAVMEGAGGAAGEAYAWAIENPDKVCCIYGENPILHSTLAKTPVIDNLAPLAKAGVPILHVCGRADPGFESQTRVAQQRYNDLGGRITVITDQGQGHYPVTPKNLKPVLDFITQNAGL